MQKSLNSPDQRPWWRFGYVWLILAGPAAVVVAGLITFFIALTQGDPVIAEDYYRQGININKSVAGDAQAASFAPALQARNHAATGVVPASPSSVKP